MQHPGSLQLAIRAFHELLRGRVEFGALDRAAEITSREVGLPNKEKQFAPAPVEASVGRNRLDGLAVEIDRLPKPAHGGRAPAQEKLGVEVIPSGPGPTLGIGQLVDASVTLRRREADRPEGVSQE